MQNFPSEKRRKMESTNASGTDETFTSPSNLEHFPIEILMRIFADVDDIGLLNLSITSCRFEKIAKVIFTERYEDEYFTIDDESDQQKEIYEEQFSRFGSGIKAIKVLGIRGIDKTHWMTEMIQKHTNRLEKLWFRDCSFKNAFDMLANHVDITHLTIIGGSRENYAKVSLPEYRNLRKLDLQKFEHFEEQSLTWILLHNPQLESLILRFAGTLFTVPEIMEYVFKYLKHLKEFRIFDEFDMDNDGPSNECIEKFTDVISGLESLGFNADKDALDIFRSISSKCGENIKELELFFPSYYLSEEMLEITNLFPNVETLSLEDVDLESDDGVLSFIGNLSHLRHLTITDMYIQQLDYILTLLRKCENLEKLVLDLTSEMFEDEDVGVGGFIHQINSSFHSKFLDATHKANVDIEFRRYGRGRTIGRVTEKEIIWRNKRVHWVGFDPIYSKSKLNLLDLANQNHDSKAELTKSQERNPFDLILGYLDLTSLYALYNCNKRSKKLIEQYAQRHSQQQGQFNINDEFHINYSGLKFFAQYVNNLEINLTNRNYMKFRSIIRTHYKKLKKLCFRLRYDDICYQLNGYILPNLEHFTFYGYGFLEKSIYTCDVTNFSELCPDLKTLELQTVVKLHASGENNPKHSFKNLRTFKFKPFNETQVKFVQDLFAESGTEIVIL